MRYISEPLKSLERIFIEILHEKSEKAIAEKGYFTLAISGGSSPMGIFQQLASNDFQRFNWKSIHLFWVDERYVPIDAKESNYGAFMSLFNEKQQGQMNSYPMYQEGVTLVEACQYYEGVLKKIHGSEAVVLDMILLGVGGDGHTASLFPQSPLLVENYSGVVYCEAPAYAPVRSRMTLSKSLINQAREIVILLVGESKRVILESLQQEKNNYPIEVIKKESMTILTDL